MKRKVWIICTILAVVFLISEIVPKKPKVISCITTMDTAYLTILADNAQFENEQKLEKKIIQLCREDRQMEEKLHISVYCSKKDLQEGKEYLIIKSNHLEQ